MYCTFKIKYGDAFGFDRAIVAFKLRVEALFFVKTSKIK